MINWPRYSWLVVILLLSSCSFSDPQATDSDGPPPPETTIDPLVVPRLDVRETTELRPYRPNSRYASVLRECALVEDYNQACTLETLPFLNQVEQNLTRTDILDRLLITHEWMGERFEALLNDAPAMMIPLFGSVTAISIGSTIRPSNYWIGTGAIQLDPERLWLSVLEKANVSIEEDYRSGYGEDLQFWFFETMRLDNEAAVRYYSLTDRQERPYEDIKLPMYRLLYHELAHAVDYFPKESVGTLSTTLRPVPALLANEHLFLSPRLNFDLPLYSQTLDELAQVRYRGEDATELQKSYTPSFLGAAMANDGAARFYAYSTQREDFATLFTQTMMKLSFDVDIYIAFVNKPEDESNYFCNELLVGWGQKNRLADALIQPRARWIIDNIYPWSSGIDSFFATRIGRVGSMVPGENWCANRDGTVMADFPETSQSQSTTVERKKSQMHELERERQIRTH